VLAIASSLATDAPDVLVTGEPLSEFFTHPDSTSALPAVRITAVRHKAPREDCNPAGTAASAFSHGHRVAANILEEPDASLRTVGNRPYRHAVPQAR
jgi:hypothetical protein